MTVIQFIINSLSAQVRRDHPFFSMLSELHQRPVTGNQELAATPPSMYRLGFYRQQ